MGVCQNTSSDTVTYPWKGTNVKLFALCLFLVGFIFVFVFDLLFSVVSIEKLKLF